MGRPINTELQKKILACYPHVYTSSIYRLVGCKVTQPYEILRRLELPIIRRTYKIEKMPNKWDLI